MFFEISALVLLLFNASLQDQLPECNTVTLYYCAFVTGSASERENAIASVHPGSVIGIANPNTEDKALEEVRKPTPGFERMYCSNHKDAFVWEKRYPGFTNPSANVSKVNVHVMDGKTSVIRYSSGQSEFLDLFLQLNCVASIFESAPETHNTSAFQWIDYNFEIPTNAIEGGKNFYYDDNLFYVGLIKYLGKTYVAKIIPDTVWLHLVLENLEPVHVLSARHVLILTSKEKDHLSWQTPADPPQTSSAGSVIYRCRTETEYYITVYFGACKGLPTSQLVQESDVLLS